MLDATGTALLAFGVFPRLDLIRSVLFMNAIGQLPSLLNLLTRLLLRRELPPTNPCLSTCLDLATTLMQLSTFFILLLTAFSPATPAWSIACGLACTSISLAKDFFNLDRPTNNFTVACLRQLFKRIHQARAKIGLVAVPVKCGVLFVISHLYSPHYLESSRVLASQRLDLFWPVFTHLAASLGFYVLCSLAFKLRMHRVCFAVPLTLITPCMLAASCLLCQMSLDGRLAWPEFR